MVDATSVAVVGSRREGPGTRVRAVTRIAGVPFVDEMTVTRWEPPHLVVVRHHRWPIRGIAWFELTATARGTRFEWVEELDPPFGALGEAGGIVLRRSIERVLAKSARKLKQVVEDREI